MTFIIKYKIYFGLILWVFLSCSTDKAVKMLSYEGIFFYYPKNWNIETENLSEESYSVKAKNNNDILFITFTNKKIDPQEYIKAYYKKIDNFSVQLTTEPFTETKFGKYNSLSSKFTITHSSAHIYGIAESFEAENKYILIIRQSNTEERFDENFEVIENSFNVRNN